MTTGSAGGRPRTKSATSRVFVAVDSEHRIVGFYSLSSFTLTIQDLPSEIARRLPRYDAIPAALIGRLARDKKLRRQRIEEPLLADSVRRILSASQSLAVFAIIADAKDDHAAWFYEGFGFRRFPLRQNRLFLLTATAVEALKRAAD